ncbi:FAD-dependent oxidoreductase [Candidatus Parcubacteria bacterium]|nr:FAD-dependent oxidoreductase [Candidatus Parcubacteria bacterium]
MYELVIIGGGPAGVAAGVYAARKMLKTLFITESFGGQSVDSMGIQNWIGTKEISGPDLAKALEEHLRTYANGHVEILKERVDKVEKLGETFKVIVGDKTFESKTVLLTVGSQRRKLDIPGAKEYENKGVTYCASCDGPLFAGQDVVVVGGGNAGFESAAQLLAYCKSVTLIHKNPEFKADEMTVSRVLVHPNMIAVSSAMPKQVKGGKFVDSFIYTDRDGNDIEIRAKGIFVEIGLLPNTSLVEGIVKLNDIKQIPVDHKNQRTSVPGLWAAGDATDTLFHQNNIAAGDAVKALEDIYLYIHAGKEIE